MSRKTLRTLLAALAVVGLGSAISYAGTALTGSAAATSGQAAYLKLALKNNDLASWWVALWNWTATAPGGATFTVNPKSSNKRTIAVQFTDLNAPGLWPSSASTRIGAAVAANVGFVVTSHCYMSDSSVGAYSVNTAGTSALTGPANTTSGYVFSQVSGRDSQVITTATGYVSIIESQTSSTVNTQYLCCEISNQGSSCSAGFTP